MNYYMKIITNTWLCLPTLQLSLSTTKQKQTKNPLIWKCRCIGKSYSRVKERTTTTKTEQKKPQRFVQCITQRWAKGPKTCLHFCVCILQLHIIWTWSEKSLAEKRQLAVLLAQHLCGLDIMPRPPDFNEKVKLSGDYNHKSLKDFAVRDCENANVKFLLTSGHSLLWRLKSFLCRWKTRSDDSYFNAIPFKKKEHSLSRRLKSILCRWKNCSNDTNFNATPF